MEILIITGSLSGGGAERVARDIANGLADLGHGISVLANVDNNYTYKLSEKVHLYNNHHNHKLPHFVNRFCILTIRKLIKKIRPDVIIGIMYGEALSAKLAVISSGLSIPVIFSDHDSFERPQGENLRRLFTKQILSRWCEYYTVLTNADKELCLKYGIKNVRTLVNPLSFSPYTIDNRDSRDNVVIAIGRLDAWHYKGFDILIQAWGSIANKYPQWHLKIVGEGRKESLDYLQKLASKYRCESQFSIEAYRTDVINLYRQSSVFVLSSRYEGFGLVLVEAMSQGCACIACDYKGRQADIVQDGINGIIAKTENVDDLANKIDLLLSNDSLRKEIQLNSTLGIEKYSIKKVANEWDTLLTEVVSRKKR